MISLAVIRSASLASGSLKLSNSRSPFWVSTSWHFRQYFPTNWEKTFCPGDSAASPTAAKHRESAPSLSAKTPRVARIPPPSAFANLRTLGVFALNPTTLRDPEPARTRTERFRLEAHTLGDIHEEIAEMHLVRPRGRDLLELAMPVTAAGE